MRGLELISGSHPRLEPFIVIQAPVEESGKWNGRVRTHIGSLLLHY